MCAAVSYRATLTVARGRMRNRFVGRGILDASVAHSIRGRQGCWPLRPAEKMAPTVHPHRGRRRGPWPLAGDCAICGWRFGRLGISPAAAGGSFAPCAARVFRPLRRAGISPRARGDQRPCLWTPRFFEKNRVKLLYGWGFIWIWCGAAESVRQRTQSMLRIVAVRGPKAPQPRQ